MRKEYQEFKDEEKELKQEIIKLSEEKQKISIKLKEMEEGME